MKNSRNKGSSKGPISTQSKTMNNAKSFISKNMTHCSSIQPFPKERDLFYNDSKQLWEKDVQRINTEQRIVKKMNFTEKSLLLNSMIFQRSNVFHKYTKKINRNTFAAFSPKNNDNRRRDFYLDYHSAKKEEKHIEKVKNMKLTPMHFKLYEGTLQVDDCINKRKVPKTHPVYDKRDDRYIKQVSFTKLKKLDFYKSHFTIE